MIALPSSPISAPAKPAPSTAARSPDAQNDIKQSQEEDGQFQEELRREMSAHNDKPSQAKESGEGAAPLEKSTGKEGQDDSPPQSPAAADSSLALLLNAALPTAVEPRMADAIAAQAATAAEPVSAAGAAKPGMADAIGAQAASASVSAAKAANTAVAEDSRGTGPKGQAQSDRNANRPDAISALADSNTGDASGEARAEFMTAARAALAESAASGKFQPAGPEKIDLAATPDARPQQHLVESAPQAQMNIGAAAQAQTATAQTATAVIATRVNAPGWDRGLGEKVVWMAGQHVQTAQMNLNPPELGPLQVTLTISNDQASAQFVSQHAAVREAIEAAMPRLREMLAEGGITLGNTSVGAESFREQAQQDSRRHVARDSAQADVGGAFQVTQSLRAVRGLVDIFA